MNKQVRATIAGIGEDAWTPISYPKAIWEETEQRWISDAEVAEVPITVFLALRWNDLDLDGELPTLTVTGTIKTETGKGTYRKPTPKTDSSVRTVALPRFAAEMLRTRREFATLNDFDAVFATRNGTWHQVVNMERRWRQIRKDTGLEWVTPHTFRKTVATLVSEQATSELAARQLGHSSSQVTRDHYIAKPPVAADLSALLEALGDSSGKHDTGDIGT